MVDVLNVLRKNAEGRFGPSPCKGLGPIIRPSLFLAPFIHDAGMEKLDGTSLVSNFCPGETEETRCRSTGSSWHQLSSVSRYPLTRSMGARATPPDFS